MWKYHPVLVKLLLLQHPRSSSIGHTCRRFSFFFIFCGFKGRLAAVTSSFHHNLDLTSANQPHCEVHWTSTLPTVQHSFHLMSMDMQKVNLKMYLERFCLLLLPSRQGCSGPGFNHLTTSGRDLIINYINTEISARASSRLHYLMALATS